MAGSRVYQTEAIIINRIGFGEADKLITLYTPEGKLRAVAKGVRRPKSKLGGHVELFTHSQMMLARGRNLDIVTQSQTINSFLPLKEDIRRTSHAFYISELINQSTAEHIVNPPLYNLLLQTLHQLCEVEDCELLMRYFEMHLLHHLGYRPQLQQCVACRLPLKAVTNSFCPTAGGMLCYGCSQSHFLTYPVSVNAQKVLLWLQSSDCDTAGSKRIAPELSREVEGITRAYLKHLLEREIKSVAWMDNLRGWETNSRQGALL